MPRRERGAERLRAGASWLECLPTSTTKAVVRITSDTRTKLASLTRGMSVALHAALLHATANGVSQLASWRLGCGQIARNAHRLKGKSLVAERASTPGVAPCSAQPSSCWRRVRTDQRDAVPRVVPRMVPHAFRSRRSVGPPPPCCPEMGTSPLVTSVRAGGLRLNAPLESTWSLPRPEPHAVCESKLACLTARGHCITTRGQ